MSSMDELGFSTIAWEWLQPQQPQPQSAATPEPAPEPEPDDGGDLDALYLAVVEAAGTDEYDERLKRYIEAAEAQDGALDSDGLWRPHDTEEALAGTRLA